MAKVSLSSKGKEALALLVTAPPLFLATAGGFAAYDLLTTEGAPPPVPATLESVCEGTATSLNAAFSRAGVNHSLSVTYNQTYYITAPTCTFTLQTETEEKPLDNLYSLGALVEDSGRRQLLNDLVENLPAESLARLRASLATPAKGPAP